MTGTRITHTIFMILAAWLLGSPAVMAREVAASRVDSCTACHGAGGVSNNPLVPTLAGQPYTLIEDNLLAFRSGKRACGPGRNDGSAAAALAQAMCTTVAALSDDDIAALSQYFESQHFEAAEQSFDPELAEQGSRLHADFGCERCHADGGRETRLMAPVLAGQWRPYLERAMNHLRSGLKNGPREMNAAIRQLSDSEVEALLDYYASQSTLED
ncbi:MAG: c-type cytochrome [Xanthomonadales bacterium]|nr:c-type cytochrome [Xanthomonadales bacterium]